MNQARLAASQKPVLLIFESDGKIKKYTLSSQTKITLGRDSENDIILSDKKCSRHQAIIDLSNTEPKIKNLNKKNPINFNGEFVESISLFDGIDFFIGSTKLRFEYELPSQAVVKTPKIKSVNPSNHSKQSEFIHHNPRPKQQSRGGNKFFFYLLVSIIIGFAWFMTMDKKKNNTLSIRTAEEQKISIESAEEKNQKIITERKRLGKDSRQYHDAQTMYLQGFRAYQNGRYSQAIQHFTAALSLHPAHEMAEVYRKKSIIKRDETIQYYMISGRQYREQNKFDFCVDAFKNVLILAGDAQSAVFKEASQMKMECELHLEGRY